MKMHPKPMIQHRAPLERCMVRVLCEHTNPLPIHIVLDLGAKTQRIVMDRDEALTLIRLLEYAVHVE